MLTDHQELRRTLSQVFDREELDTLCFDLGIDYRRLAGQRLSERAGELVEIVDRQGRTDQLLDLLRQKRPRLFGGARAFEPDPPVPSAAEVLALDRVGLRRLLSAHLTNAHIRALEAELGLDVERLPALTRPGQARELIVLLEDQGRLEALRARLARHVSGEDPILSREPSRAVAPEPVAESSAPPPPDPASPLAERVAFYFDDLRALCFDLGLDYDELGGEDHPERARDLVDLCAERGCLDGLRDLLNRAVGSKEAMIGKQAKTLIRLHLAMVDCFSQKEVARFARTLLGDKPGAKLSGTAKRDQVRELILAAWRRGRVPELVDLCRQARPDFRWQERDLSELYRGAGEATRVTPEQLLTTLAHQFSQDDLRQLAFYLGLDFEQIKGPHGMFYTFPDVSPGERRWLRDNLGVDSDALTVQELDILLKKLWAEEFIDFCRAEEIWAQAVAVSRYLYFQDVLPRSVQPRWEWPQVPFEPDLDTPEHRTLIQLYQAMAQRCDQGQVDRLGRATLEQDYEQLEGAGRRAQVRELILTLDQRGRLPELVDHCQRLLGEFGYQDVEIDWLYRLPESADPIDEDRLLAVLATRFSQDDLRQLCFYLGIHFDDIMGWDDPRTWSERTRRHFRQLGIDDDQLDLAELNAALQERWVERFVAFCREKGIWPQTVAVSFHLRPDAFRDGDPRGAPG